MTDVLTLSDLRLPGGTSHSNAEELVCQHRLGLVSELVQLNGGLSAQARGLNPRLESLIRSGHAQFRPTPTPREASVAIARHPAMLAAGHDPLGPVTVDHLVLVVNATPIDWLGREHWRPEDVHELATDLFGVEPLWSPIGPNAREAILGRVPPERLRAEDWVNIIDVDHWWVDRSERRRDRRPVVGRHSRASVQKWPEQPERDLVYPRDGRFDIQVLGWGQVLDEVLGPPPDSWTVHTFGTLAPREFLAGLDFFVYFHHPNLVEAFGRTVLEAIASGLPAILPPHFEPLFGAAALYAEPSGVADVIEALWEDEEAYRAHVALAGTLVRHRFGYEAHGRRLAELLPAGRVHPLAPAESSESTETGESITLSEAPGPAPAEGQQPVLLIDVTGDTADRDRAAAALPHGASVVAALSTNPALAGQVPWCDVLPTATECSLPDQAWEDMAARRVRSLLAAHPEVPVAVVGDLPPGGALEGALEARRTLDGSGPSVETEVER